MAKSKFGLKNTVLHIGADDEGHPTSTKFEFVVKTKKDKGIDASPADFYLEWFLDEDHTKKVEVIADFKIDSYDKETGNGTGNIATIPRVKGEDKHFSAPGKYYAVLRSWVEDIQDLGSSIEFVKLKRVHEYKLRARPLNVKYDGNLEFIVSHVDGTMLDDNAAEYFKISLGTSRDDSLDKPIWFTGTTKKLSKDFKEVLISKGTLNSSKKDLFTESFTGEVYARLFVRGKADNAGSYEFLPTEEVIVINVRKEQDLFDVTKSSFSITGPKTIYIEPDPIN